MTTERSSMVSETQSDGTAISPLLESLPDPVRDALAAPGIDATQFNPVLTAFGALPTEGQIALANRLIAARGQYVVDRAWACSTEIRTAASSQKRLRRIGKVARQLLELIQRDGLGHQPLNPHPAITLALPQLFQCRADRVWDHGLGQFCAMLGDLAKVGAKADKVFPSSGKHGGPRGKDLTAKTVLIERLIGIYEFLREQYPESGPTPACDAPLIEFVRAGLAFVVSAPPEIIDSDGNRWQLAEVWLLESDLPKKTRTTESAIRGVYDRLHRSS